MEKLTLQCITYNDEKFIAQALDSFLAQETTFPFRILIADDASTDNNQSILKAYQEQYPERLELILREKNLGSRANWVSSLYEISSQYLIICNGDDYFTDPLKLQKQVDFLDNNPEFSMCFHPVKVIWDDKSQSDSIFPKPAYRYHKDVFNLQDILKQNFISINSCMYRWCFNGEKDLSKFFPDHITPGDHLTHLFHAQKGKIGFIDEIMSVYRKHSNSMWHGANVSDDWFFKYGIKHINFYLALEEFFGADKSQDIHNFMKKTVLAMLKLKKFDVFEQLSDDYTSYFFQAVQEISEDALNTQRNDVKKYQKLADKKQAIINDLQHHIDKQNEIIKKQDEMLKQILKINN